MLLKRTEGGFPLRKGGMSQHSILHQQPTPRESFLNYLHQLSIDVIQLHLICQIRETIVFQKLVYYFLMRVRSPSSSPRHRVYLLGKKVRYFGDKISLFPGTRRASKMEYSCSSIEF